MKIGKSALTFTLLSLMLQSVLTLSTGTAKSRRQLFQNVFKTSVLTTAFTAASIPLPSHYDKADALELCRAKARNCIRTTWTAPKMLSKTQAIGAITEVLNSYPQNGQNGIDCNGWSIVGDHLSSLSEEEGTNIIRLEFRSCVGPAAVAFNLAQPFVDDVILELKGIDSDSSLTVDVKSSSRMGSSDLFVNKKRIEFLGHSDIKIKEI